jgi:hypothetical protein
MSKAKTMNRSRNQIATSYAPESFFTFEGGLGACIARSTEGAPISLADATMDLIFERMGELGRAWFESALAARVNDPKKAQVLPSQCVDPVLLDNSKTTFQLPGQDRFYLCKPSEMGYTPAPLSFVCRTCGMFKDYENLASLDKDLPNLTPEHCPDPKQKGTGSCDWEQLDVVFVHWSGNWESPFPGQWHWSGAEGKVVKRRDSCICGSKQFRLNRRSAAVGDWFYECASCGKPLSPKWLQNDPATLGMLRNLNDPDRLTDVRMQVTPYRASSAYYVKSDLFIDFKDSPQQLLTRLRPGREEELKDFVASTYGFVVTPITDADVEAACKGKAECAAEYAQYIGAVSSIKGATEQLAIANEAMRPFLQQLIDQAHLNRQNVLNALRDRSILLPRVSLPSTVVSNLAQRQTLFASKFDPFRLAVEHATLKQTRLDVETKVNGKRKYVSFVRLDEDLAPDEKAECDALQADTQLQFDKLGIEDMGLIREFDLCRFSFGYSRMESTPVLKDKRGMDMPVRLNLFPPVRHNESFKYPVYVVQQSNEAIYVRLKESVVLEWLQGQGCPDMFTLAAGERVGAGTLATAQPMGPFLDGLPRSDQPQVYFYLYTLLHSYSHLLMKHIAEYSGLDLGSLGEYIFPADLAFVVYRNGTTMDLGNLTALWRNSGPAMLKAMLGTKATQCGTGSLCGNRGGACPDCVMIPETSCVASNKLLSRSVLRSIGGRPRFDTRSSGIKGYLDFVKPVQAANG